MFNDGLRARLQTELPQADEIALIRDALVEEMRLRSSAEASKAQELEREFARQQIANAELSQQTRIAEEERARSVHLRDEAERMARETAAAHLSDIAVLQTQIGQMGRSQQALEAETNRLKTAREHKTALFKYIALLAITTITPLRS